MPSRAPLPAGTPNYVTAQGLALLRRELAELEAERARLALVSDEQDRGRRLAVNAGRLLQLNERISSAHVVDPSRQPRDQVRFGATVDLRSEADEHVRYTIVGVDEAAPAVGRIAFLSPLATAILGLRVGDTATIRTAGGERNLEVEAIRYDANDESGGPPPK